MALNEGDAMHLNPNTIGEDARAVHESHKREWTDDGARKVYLRALASAAAAVGKRDIVAASLGLTLDDHDVENFTLFVATKDYAVIVVTEVEGEDTPDSDATILPWRTLESATFAASDHEKDSQSFESLELAFEGGLFVTFDRRTETSESIDALAVLVRERLAL